MVLPVCSRALSKGGDERMDDTHAAPMVADVLLRLSLPLSSGGGEAARKENALF